MLASSSLRTRLAYASRLRSFMVCREMMQRKVFAGIVEKPHYASECAAAESGDPESSSTEPAPLPIDDVI